MIISQTTYYIIVGVIVACCILPTIYGYITQKEKFQWIWVISLLTIPLNWYTPAIYDVTDCGVYTKKKLLLSTDDFNLGWHNYIINNSDKDLYFEYITYGDARLKKDEYDMIIGPGTTYEAPVTSIHYLFTDAPSSVKSKSGGQTKYRLSCDVPDWEEMEEFDEGEEYLMKEETVILGE